MHLAHGMQCADCHFDIDVHGNGMLYGEPRNATTINCVDCHGTDRSAADADHSGNAGQVDLLNNSNTPWGPRFVWEGTKLFQQSIMSPDVRWEIPQTIDTIDPLSSHYNPKSAYAKTLRRDGKTWGGDVPAEPPSERARRKLAHDNSAMDCQICHTSWATSCFGCHLPMKANQRVPQNKFEGVTDRNLHHLQSAGRARRRFHARDRRHGEEKSDGGDPLVERGRGQLAKRESRMGLLAAANVFRGRLQRPGVQSAFPAHHQRRRHDEELHRLPSLEERTTTTPG